MPRRYEWARWPEDRLLKLRLKDLHLSVEGTWLARCLRDLHEELEQRDLRIRPHVWLSDEWFTPDGIPGLDGFGEKGAAALLGAYPKLEDIPGDPDRWPRSMRSPGALNATLRAHWDDALLYRKLATVVEDVPLAQKPADLAYSSVDEERFWAFAERQGMRRR